MEEGAKLGACHNNNNEVGDGMQCIHHPHHTNTTSPGAICAFCLQEKLGKLLSSSFPSLPPSSSSSSSSSSPSPSPSFTPPPPPLSLKTNHHTRSRIPFLVQNKNNSLSTKNKKPSTTSNCSSSGNIIFKRSKSTVTSTRSHGHFIHHDHDFFSPRKRNGFWSFLYPSSKEAKSPNGKQRQTQRKSDHVIMEEEKCFGSSSSKVSRSRSVGCGSRSFSADFFERISSGLGDCTLRRVESHREGKHKVVASASSASSSSSSSSGAGGVVNHCMKERVRCGGIFGGFAVTSSSSSAYSSSWVSSTVDDGRGRSWGWAFASPIRAFTTKGSSSKRDASDKNATPNLSAIPSLLTVRG
ncbi:sericin-2-like [Vigna umbellata]|uniref:sericin-2-like n=1 Tax=Vigna umbellata TaxID=87088 RepID=UPI001F5EDA34|nr:sericin-2-like [Vigna umbellata]